MTVCLLIEFSNRFQSFYSEAWFQTLTPPTALCRR